MTTQNTVQFRCIALMVSGRVKISPNKRCLKSTKSNVYWYKADKTEDTIGSCQRLVFAVGVSQHMHIMWTFELNRSSKLRDINERKNNTLAAPWSHEVVCAFRCLILRHQTLNLGSRNRKLLLSRKLRYFRGSCFSQWFILSVYPHYS